MTCLKSAGPALALPLLFPRVRAARRGTGISSVPNPKSAFAKSDFSLRRPRPTTSDVASRLHEPIAFTIHDTLPVIEQSDDAAASTALSSFFRERGLALAMVIGILLIISLLQGGLSYSVLLGALRDRYNVDSPLLAGLQWLVRAGLLVLAGTFWALKRKRAVFRVIIVANTFFTTVLLSDVGLLLSMLSGSTSRAAVTMLADVTLIAASNILIFSIWYWIIDPPGVMQADDADQPWAFLFPQRGGVLPHYESWLPHYADYLFIAFTTSFAFSPTDALPLTGTAKMLMLVQAAISVVTLTGIAGAAINILAGNG